jgi:hypothetical protein
MLNLPQLPETPVAENTAPNPRNCSSPGCRHEVNESWDAAGLRCTTCVIEGELFDREGRWDGVI